MKKWTIIQFVSIFVMMTSFIVDFFVEDASWSFALDMLYCVALLLVVVMMLVRYKAEKNDLLTNRTNTDHTYKRIRWYYESDLKWLYKS